MGGFSARECMWASAEKAERSCCRPVTPRWSAGRTLPACLDDQIERRESADETADFARQLVTKIQGDRPELDAWLRRLITGNWRPDGWACSRG